jgi:hypothetical protein
MVRQVLAAPEEAHQILLAETDTAGLVAVHAAYSADGLLVVSVMADRAVAQDAVHEATHDVAVMLARADAQRVLVAPTTAVRRSLFDLPLGEGHGWTISERVITSSATRERYEALLPAWAARGEHDLTSRQSLGFVEAAAALKSLCRPDVGPLATVAHQSARARFDRLGFEAAAITAIAALAGPRPERVVQRTAELRFNRPYAVVALTVDRARQAGRAPARWHGIPVFSAWVDEPTDPDANDDA